jgi:nucleoside-diphosphate-sugar epimerase
MKPVVILGAAGAIGTNFAHEMVRRELPFVAVGRTRQTLEERFDGVPQATLRAADLSTEAGARAACEGAEVAVYCVGVPYTRFDLHPVLMKATVAGAAAAGVRKLIVISSVYSYGVPQTVRVAEGHPREPNSRKGEFRKQQEDLALEADGKGGLRTLVLHLPDFFGTYADQSLGNRIFRAALANKTADWLGDVDLPHEFFFVPDAAPVLLQLLDREDVWGERYNLGGFGTVVPRDFIRSIYIAACRRPRFRTAGRGLLRTMGLFDSMMRELLEMQYLVETPVFLDDTKLQAKLGGIAKTPYANAITATLAWMKDIPSLA